MTGMDSVESHAESPMCSRSRDLKAPMLRGARLVDRMNGALPPARTSRILPKDEVLCIRAKNELKPSTLRTLFARCMGLF